MPGETDFPRKFHSNTIKFVLDEVVAQARDEAKREALKSRLCQAMDCKPKQLAWMLNNGTQPTVAQLAVAAQVLGVSMDALIKLEDEPAAAVPA